MLYFLNTIFSTPKPPKGAKYCKYEVIWVIINYIELVLKPLSGVWGSYSKYIIKYYLLLALRNTKMFASIKTQKYFKSYFPKKDIYSLILVF